MQRRDETGYPETYADAITWEYSGCALTILQPYGAEAYLSHWCGYARVPNWPEGVSTDYNESPIGKLSVHGGVTYTELDGDGSIVVGFDCAHLGDDKDPQKSNEEWLRRETEQMADQLLAAIGRAQIPAVTE